jgi:CheY-like chemotaxis protein
LDAGSGAKMLRMLIVEDQDADAELAIRALRRGGLAFEWERVETEAAFREALGRAPDLVLSDINVPGFGGLAALRIVQAEAPGTPLVVLSGAMWEQGGQEALAAGAADFVCKADMRALLPAVKRALAGRQPPPS